ncbi:MAG: MBL fold metallo-hydrolase [Bacteroidetes bacterium]|nr:MBL fold metallo-hydrolase [Bacteroidota bacterium]
MIGCSCPVCCSADSRDKRWRTSAVVEYQNKKFQIDIGPDFRAQMLHYGIMDFDALLLTHEHKNHVAGFDDIRALNVMNQKRYPIYASKSCFDNTLEQFPYIAKNPNYDLVPKFDFHEIKGGQSFNHDGVDIMPIDITHGNLSILGFRFGALTYITDASLITSESIEKIRGTKILVINALRYEKHATHFTVNEALECIDKIQPEQAYLLHFSHQIGTHEEVSRKLPQNVFMAYDGLRVEF